jgi:hypothetical protein
MSLENINLAKMAQMLAQSPDYRVLRKLKRRKSKMKAHQLTPEVFAAFDAGDEYSLRRALRLPPGMRLARH